MLIHQRDIEVSSVFCDTQLRHFPCSIRRNFKTTHFVLNMMGSAIILTIISSYHNSGSNSRSRIIYFIQDILTFFNHIANYTIIAFGKHIFQRSDFVTPNSCYVLILISVTFWCLYSCISTNIIIIFQISSLHWI